MCIAGPQRQRRGPPIPPLTRSFGARRLARRGTRWLPPLGRLTRSAHPHEIDTNLLTVSTCIERGELDIDELDIELPRGFGRN